MTTREISEKIILIIVTHPSPNAIEMPVTLATKLTYDCGFDSLDIAEIAQEINQAFEVCITEDELKGVATVHDLVTLVEQKLKT